MTVTKSSNIVLEERSSKEEIVVNYNGQGRGFDIVHTVETQDDEDPIATETLTLSSEQAVKIAVFIMAMSS